MNLPTVSSGYSEVHCRSGAAEREVMERTAAVIEIGWSEERHFCRSRSPHALLQSQARGIETRLSQLFPVLQWGHSNPTPRANFYPAAK